VDTASIPIVNHGMRVMSSPQNIRCAQTHRTLSQAWMDAAERIGIFGIACLTGRLDRDVRMLRQGNQFRQVR
jgi:hypothetical protein